MSHFAGIPIYIETDTKKRHDLEIKTYRLTVLPAIFKLTHYPVIVDVSFCRDPDIHRDGKTEKRYDLEIKTYRLTFLPAIFKLRHCLQLAKFKMQYLEE